MLCLLYVSFDVFCYRCPPPLPSPPLTSPHLPPLVHCFAPFLPFSTSPPEAVRACVPPAVAPLLLRAFVPFLRGFCISHYHHHHQQQPQPQPQQQQHKALALARSDDQVKRAATWLEAILDAHFSVLALNASRHEATRRALTGALEAGNYNNNNTHY